MAEESTAHAGSFASAGGAWLAACRCGESFSGSSYEAAEDLWREHAWLSGGVYYPPFGRKDVPRWERPAG